MGQIPDKREDLSPTLNLCEFRTGGAKGFWLYDTTRGMNLAMRAPTERAAFLEAIEYYQNRLTEVERNQAALRAKVNAFLAQFADGEAAD